MGTYKSVKEMIHSLSEDKAFKELALNAIEGKQVSKLLFLLRCKQGLSQKEMAERIGCSQGKISKIESSYDHELSVKELLDYGKALKLQLEIGYREPSFKLVDQVKYHAFKMKACLDELCRLAKDDAEFIEAARKFYGEAFVNVLGLIVDSYKKLPASQKEKSQKQSPIQVSAPLGAPEACSA